MKTKTTKITLNYPLEVKNNLPKLWREYLERQPLVDPKTYKPGADLLNELGISSRRRFNELVTDPEAIISLQEAIRFSVVMKIPVFLFADPVYLDKAQVLEQLNQLPDANA